MKSKIDSLTLGIAPLGAPRRGQDVLPVGIIHLAGLRTHVRAIDREAGDHFLQCGGKAVEREVARPSMLLGDVIEPTRQHRHLARHRGFDDELLACVHDIAEVRPLADEVGVQIAKAAMILTGDEEPPYDVHELVAGGAVDRPWLELLVLAEDLLDHEVERPLSIGRALALARDSEALRCKRRKY